MKKRDAERLVHIVEFGSEVIDETGKQEARFGLQEHPLDRWCSILGEEMGEVARAVNEYMYTNTHDLKNLKEELIQTAAVAASWYAHIVEIEVREAKQKKALAK